MIGRNRLEAFSDGVLAIVITIMVLELKIPHGHDLQTLLALMPKFFSYVLSFVYVGIYWNNHHHLIHTVHKVNGRILWANLNLLFWLSLFPFANGWMGENHFAPLPTALYGIILLMAAIAYWILARVIIAVDGKDSLLKKAVGKGHKENLSLIIYAVAIPLAFINNWIAQMFYVAVALLWLIPDKRIEKILGYT